MNPSLRLNLNALQTFYYVAKYGGVTAARRHLPYGLTDAAIRAQLKQLQADIGFALIGSNPFHLTPAGQNLFDFIGPFLEQLGPLITRLNIADLEVLRVGGTRVVFRAHFPGLLEALRPKFPHLTCVMREGLRSQVNEWFTRREIDFAITVLEGPVPPGCEAELLMRLPMELLVHRKTRVHSLAKLLQPGRIDLPLITPFREDNVARAFHRAMAERGIDGPAGTKWTPSMSSANSSPAKPVPGFPWPCRAASFLAMCVRCLCRSSRSSTSVCSGVPAAAPPSAPC